MKSNAAATELIIASYSNGRLGYLPDEHDIAARSCAGYQSPKYCDHFPFTPKSGAATLDAIGRCRAR